jgi:hypothetical protein
MPKTWNEWETVEVGDTLPAGVYDLKLDSEQDFYSELRTALIVDMPVTKLDKVLTANYGRAIIVTAAKRVPAAVQLPSRALAGSVSMSVTDYDVLLSMARALTDYQEADTRRETLETLFELVTRVTTN